MGELSACWTLHDLCIPYVPNTRVVGSLLLTKGTILVFTILLIIWDMNTVCYEKTSEKRRYSAKTISNLAKLVESRESHLRVQN